MRTKVQTNQKSTPDDGKISDEASNPASSSNAKFK